MMGRGGGGGGFQDNFGRDRGYSPERRRHEMSPPPKRMRPNWGEEREGGFGERFDREYDRPPPPRHFGGGRSQPKDKEDSEGGFQPLMMSFKNFLSTQDDTITDEEAIKKYAEYKLEFMRQQLNEFFVTHKDEEWFKLKYHAEDGVKRKEELRSMLKRRVEVFQEFMDAGKIDGLTIDGDKQEQLIRLLDSVVIKLEGGSDYDLEALDLPEKEEKREDKRSSRDGRDIKRDEVGANEQSAELRKAKELLEFLKPKKESESESGKKRKRGESEDEDEADKDKDDNEDKVKDDNDKEEKDDKEETKEDEMEGTEKETKETDTTEETGKADELDAVSDGEGPGKMTMKKMKKMEKLKKRHLNPELSTKPLVFSFVTW